MLKVIIIAVGIGLVAYVAITWTTVASLPADQLTLDLKVKSQAEISIAVTGMSNRLKQTMATGTPDAGTRAVLRDDLAHLHQDVEEARTKLTTLGDTPAQVDHWLDSIHWADLVALEADFNKANPGN